jgi:1-acyl-sn-glycerol-3-phosphate acyltransferase
MNHCRRGEPMQNIVIAEPYRFIPPMTTTFWTWPLRYWMPRRVRKAYGVVSAKFYGKEKIREAMAAGHGVLIAPNHCRPCDPEVIALLCCQLDQPCFMMASWFLFKQSRLQRFMLRSAGAFSVNREGVDRESVRMATGMLVDGRRPLIIFPEGIVSRSNGRLRPLMDGTAFIARAAAKVRAKDAKEKKVVIIPVALHYYFDGDLHKSVEPVLAKIESRLSWQPQVDLPLVQRILKLGEALLSMKEMEYFGCSQSGEIADRLPKLLEMVIVPMEQYYKIAKPGDDVMERIKTIRTVIVGELVEGKLAKPEVERRWRHLADCYFAQQLGCYPVNYLAGKPSVERLLETVERYEEDLTDAATCHRPLRCVGQVGDPIEVSPERVRGTADPAMKALEESLSAMLKRLEADSTVWEQ